MDTEFDVFITKCTIIVKSDAMPFHYISKRARQELHVLHLPHLRPYADVQTDEQATDNVVPITHSPGRTPDSCLTTMVIRSIIKLTGYHLNNRKPWFLVPPTQPNFNKQQLKSKKSSRLVTLMLATGHYQSHGPRRV